IGTQNISSQFFIQTQSKKIPYGKHHPFCWELQYSSSTNIRNKQTEKYKGLTITTIVNPIQEKCIAQELLLPLKIHNPTQQQPYP
ncbi:MAG: hypothetical protein MJZ02_09665, partial [Paludibacteraceae bacterium]|nr:hypothetical protein [Paludibacteraceae bacterium]